MKKPKTGSLTRVIHLMPDFVSEALQENNLMVAYYHRPAYQQNDYVGWIARAKRLETKTKRLSQIPNDIGHAIVT